MSYDADSFKAGFALGRMLWRPPQDTNIAPGLGWTADPGWITYRAGIIAVVPPESSSNRTPYTKTNNGMAIVCTLYNGDGGRWGGDWCDVVVISTVRDNVLATVPNASFWIKTYTYLGLTWYVGASGQNARYGGSTVIDSDFPAIDMDGGQAVNDRNSDPTIIETVFLRIMQEANVRLIE